jgi:hypothetical protein
MDRFAGIDIARMVEQERDSLVVKMRIKPRGTLEGTHVELLRIFEHDLGFVRNRFAHGIQLHR